MDDISVQGLSVLKEIDAPQQPHDKKLEIGFHRLRVLPFRFHHTVNGIIKVRMYLCGADHRTNRRGLKQNPLIGGRIFSINDDHHRLVVFLGNGQRGNIRVSVHHIGKCRGNIPCFQSINRIPDEHIAGALTHQQNFRFLVIMSGKFRTRLHTDRKIVIQLFVIIHRYAPILLSFYPEYIRQWRGRQSYRHPWQGLP